nr:protein CBFA2T3-like [Salvelinus alpinus]
MLNGSSHSSHSPTSLNGAPSTPNGFSNGPAMSSTASLSNQQLPPACGARQLCKLKRFLTTLQQFGNDISPEIGERVRSLVLGLVNSTLTIEEFHSKLQEATNFPLRPFVIPFLKVSTSKHNVDTPSLFPEGCLGIPRLFSSMTKDSERDGHHPEHLAKRPCTISPVTGVDAGAWSGLARVSERIPGRARASAGRSLAVVRSREALLELSLLRTPRETPSPTTTAFGAGRRELEPSSPLERVSGRTAHGLRLERRVSPENTALPGRPPVDPGHRPCMVPLSQEVFAAQSGALIMSPPPSLLPSSSPLQLLNCIMDMVEKTRRSLTVLRRCQEADREEMNHWIRRYSDVEDMKKGGSNGQPRPPPPPLPLPPHNSSNTPNNVETQQPIEIHRDFLHRPASGYLPEEIWRKAEEAVNEVKRQAMSELQKAVSDAERKAHEMISAERSKMERALAEARKQASEDALTVINQQEDSSESCWNCGRKASETCSGCNTARYCGSFCQHKDWEKHHHVCGQGLQGLPGGSSVPLGTPSSSAPPTHSESTPPGPLSLPGQTSGGGGGSLSGSPKEASSSSASRSTTPATPALLDATSR